MHSSIFNVFLPEIKQKVIELLGKEAYLNDTEINKKYIAQKIFSDKHVLEKINGMIHGAVKNDFEEFVTEHNDNPFVFKETNLLFEAGLQHFSDVIVLVTAPKEKRIQRVMQRDNLSREEVIQRMNTQWEDEEKIKHCHFMINNEEDEPLLPKVLRLVKSIKTSIY
ncbi:MAG: hypothetical protein Fur0023_16750 [Bacteroidia bacterium]